MGCTRMKNEPCMYMYKEENIFMLIVIYVDDIIIASNNEYKTKWFKEQLKNEFEVKDIGKLKYFLGIEFTNTENGIIVTQRKYIQELIQKYKMDDCNTVNTPLDPNTKLTKGTQCSAQEEQEEVNKVPYQNLIGSLLYLAVTTRPDIAYAVSKLSQFNNYFNRAHWIATKRVVRYLKGTINLGLIFRKTDEDIKGYVDADWASSTDDRKSCTGYFFKLSNSAVSWEVEKQQTVALSSAEAEYMAMTEACKEAIYLKNILNEIGFRVDKPVTLFNDNQSAQTMARTEGINSRSKHIDIKHHFIKDAILAEKVRVEYMNTTSMPADILTKSLSCNNLQKCIKGISMVEINKT